MSISLEESEVLHGCAPQLAAGELPPGWEVVPSSSYTRVAFNPTLEVYYKEYMPRNPLEALKDLLRGSRATLARKRGDALLYVGIEAPESLAWGRLPGGGEYLFMRAAAGRDVGAWLKTILVERSGEALAIRRQLLENLGVFIGRVHATGFVHGDLKPANVFADLREGRFQFTLVNNEFTVQKLPPPGRMLLRNLMQLNLLPPSALTRTDRMRFFRGWRRQLRELSPIETKLLAAEAYHWAMRCMYDRGQL